MSVRKSAAKKKAAQSGKHLTALDQPEVGHERETVPDALVIAIVLVAGAGEHLDDAVGKARGQANSSGFYACPRFDTADSKQLGLVTFLEANIEYPLTAVHLSFRSHEKTLRIVCFFLPGSRCFYDSVVGIAVETQRIGAEKFEGDD